MDRERAILTLGARLNSRERAWLKTLRLVDPRAVVSRGDLPPGVGEALEHALGRLLREQYMSVAALSAGELSGARGRSYAAPAALPEESWRMVADYYAHYLPKLRGVVEQDLRERVRSALQAGERAGEDNATLADRLRGILDSFQRSRLWNIVRTEGTRAASLARRHVALLARESGYGPDYYIGSAILDDRTTHTCSFWHGHRWSLEEDAHGWSILHVPNHYQCRSLVRYGYKGLDDDVPEWTQQRVDQWIEIQRGEFPRWDNHLIYVPDEGLLSEG